MKDQRTTTRITKRAVLIGALLIIANSYWIAYVEMIWHTAHLTTVSLSVNVMFAVVMLTWLNMMVLRVYPQAALSQQDLLIIYDDMDLPLGKIRIRPSGSAGGHRGMESIVGALKSPNFTRIRIGIGRPPPGMSEVEFVLGNFTAEEGSLIGEAVGAAQNAAVDVIGHGPDWAMNRYN